VGYRPENLVELRRYIVIEPAGKGENFPFNWDFIPKIFDEDIFDETKTVRFRGGRFVLWYTISSLVWMCGVFGLISLLVQANASVAILKIGAYIGGTGGVILGLASWWEFHKAVKKKALESEATNKNTPSP
jgi:hypothetical protein